MNRVWVLAACGMSACTLYPSPDPGEVEVSCELQPQEPTTEQPNPPQDPCAPWGPEAVHTDLLIHQRLWRETFPDTDEWAAEAPLLPHEIVILDVEDVCDVVTCRDEERYPGGVAGKTFASGVVYISKMAYCKSCTDPSNPASSSLAHELMHVALAGAYGDPDRNHLEPGGPWDQSREDYIWTLRETWLRQNRAEK